MRSIAGSIGTPFASRQINAPFSQPVSARICESVPQVRRHAVVLLTQLVLEDYVELRGPLFYHLVCALADPDDGVRQSAEHAVLAASHNAPKASFMPNS